MTAQFIAFLLAGAACGGFVNGLAGFGTALFALGWWLQVMPPTEAVPIVLALSVVSGAQGVYVVRRSVSLKRLAPFLAPALLAIPAGLYALAYVDGDLMKLAVGGFLLLYGAFFTFRSELPDMRRPPLAADAAVGLAGGFLGAVAGLSGALPTMWLAMRNLRKEETRAILQPFNLIILAISAIGLALQGAYVRQVLIYLAIALPVSFLATRAGIATFRRLSDGQFRKLLIWLMFCSGALIVLRELW